MRNLGKEYFGETGGDFFPPPMDLRYKKAIKKRKFFQIKENDTR